MRQLENAQSNCAVFLSYSDRCSPFVGKEFRIIHASMLQHIDLQCNTLQFEDCDHCIPGSILFRSLQSFECLHN